MKETLTAKARRILSVTKEKFRRQMADFTLSRNTLLEIFGTAFKAKVEDPSNRHNSIGKNYFNAHGPHHNVRSHAHHPAGTKLVRRFLRSNNGSHHYRALYKNLTGKAFDTLEGGE